MPTESSGYELMKKMSGLLACTARTGEVGGAERVAAVVDDLEPRLLDILVGAVGDEPRRLAVGGDHRQRLGLRVLRHRHLEEALAERGLGVGPGRMHGEIARILELGV